MRPSISLLAACAALVCAPGLAQVLETRFSCSTVRTEDGEKLIYSDIGNARLRGDRIESFSWESALYRSTHGFDCSIDDGDGLVAEVREEAPRTTWRVALKNPLEARARRGYDYAHGINCSIRLVREGDRLEVKPSCPAMCGSRPNFTSLSVNISTGECRYEE
ncbi:MAG TPA: hypothetical protein VIM12_01060 [Noviherbaspirillum sp.]|jgi:hypothetical protein|uniref:hypothetical protein n=1 Tax=Noviherbaspirillum sp. TaxID=1926288 RepID=UPI002F92327D